MEDKNNISIFQGSTVEADTAHDFLAQQGVASLVRNHMQENLDAGWVTAAADHAAEVFVAKEDEAKAVDLLKNLFNEGSGTPASQQQPQRVTDDPAVIVVMPQPDATRNQENRPTSPPPPPTTPLT